MGLLEKDYIFFCKYILFVCLGWKDSCSDNCVLCSICIMAFGVADDDGNTTTNGIVTGCITLLMSLLLLGCAFKVRLHNLL